MELNQTGEQTEQNQKAATDGILSRISIHGIAAGVYQYQSISGANDAQDHGRGAVVFQPEIGMAITDADEIFFKLGFGANNGLNHVNPFVLTPWAADLEDDVKNLNGRNRDYLLTAWYTHSVAFGSDHSLGLTGGIIDATDYLDQNAFANDEFSQFMNQALVNGPNGFSPSYDFGGAIEWEYSNLSLKGVLMRVGANDDGSDYTFWGSQLGYHRDATIGEGNYRIIFQQTSHDFLDPAGTRKESCEAVYLSCDQEFGPLLGGWIRFGIHDDDHAADYQNLLSGGITGNGTLWGRKQDTIGIGYAYLNQGSADIDYTHVAEAYVRFALHSCTALTLDAQYEDDRYHAGGGDDVHGWITGMRVTAEF